MSQSSNIKFTYFSGDFQLQTNEMSPEDLLRVILADENTQSATYSLDENDEFTATPNLSKLEQEAYEQYKEFVTTTRAFLREKKRWQG